MAIRNCPTCGCDELYWDEFKEEILNSHYIPRAANTCRVCDCSRPELHSPGTITNHPPTWPGYIDNRRN